MKRGLYRYETGPGRWWACFYDDERDERVNIVRARYEQMGIEPAFERLPIIEDEDLKDKQAFWQFRAA